MKETGEKRSRKIEERRLKDDLELEKTVRKSQTVVKIEEGKKNEGNDQQLCKDTGTDILYANM